MRTKRPITVTTTLILIFINALIWLAGAILQAFSIYFHPGGLGEDVIGWSMVILLLSFTILWVTLAIFLTRHNKVAYYIAAAIFILEAALTIREDLSRIGWLFLILTITALVSLISSRRWFLQSPIER